MPGFHDQFAEPNETAEHWSWAGSWEVTDGRLTVAPMPFAAAYPNVPLSGAYLVEATMAFAPEETGRGGLIAWRDMDGHELRAGLDLTQQEWFWELHAPNGIATRVAQPLPSVAGGGPRLIRVENNAGHFTADVDGVRQPAFELPHPLRAPGTPGIFAESAAVTVEHFLVTRGWEEWGSDFHGWAKHGGSSPPTQTPFLLEGNTIYLKGDELERYEFTVQLTSAGECAVYPVYIDQNNSLSVEPIAAFDELRIVARQDGEIRTSTTVPVVPRVHRAHSAEQNGNHLRFVRSDGEVLVFAEGKLLIRTPDLWSASRVGVGNIAAMAQVHAVTLHELP